MGFTSIPFKRKGAFRSGIPGENEGGSTSVQVWREVAGLRKEQWQKYCQNMSEKKKHKRKTLLVCAGLLLILSLKNILFCQCIRHRK